jgi:hypothetical protein
MPGRRIILAFCLILVSSGLPAQQAVPPPPRPQPDGPSLGSIFESLKRTLVTSGQVEFTLASDPDYRPGVVRSRITDVAVNAADCRVRVNFVETPDTPMTEKTVSYFLETIDSAEVMTLQEARNLPPHSTDYKVSGGYETVINGNLGRLRFADRNVAMRVAELLRQASEICRSAPVPLNAAAGKPTLGETLLFIQQKLNDEAAARWDGQSVSDAELISHQSARVLDAQSDPDACLLRYRLFQTYDNKPLLQWNIVLSFRRVQKLEVLTEQQSSDQMLEQIHEQTGLPVYDWRLTPTVYQLRVTYSGGTVAAMADFVDESMADRVAKAMNHAAELCRPESKEPF